MKEYFWIYDSTTGENMARGSGPVGSASVQEVGEGRTLLMVPGSIFMAAPLPVEPLREIIWERAKLCRAAAEAGGCETPAGRVDTDLESLVRITGAVQAASIALAAGDTLELDWTMADNNVVTLDAPALVAMGRAVALHVDAVHQHGRDLRALIDAAETGEALLVIGLAAGWPGQPLAAE